MLVGHPNLPHTMSRKSEEVLRRQKEMDECVKSFNMGLLTLPVLVRPYASRDGASMLLEGEVWLKAALKADFEIVIKRAMKHGWFDRYHEGIVARDMDYFRSINLTSAFAAHRVPDRNKNYYVELVSHVTEAWEAIPADVRVQVWDAIAQFYTAYLKYSSA